MKHKSPWDRFRREQITESIIKVILTYIVRLGIIVAIAMMSGSK